MMTGQLSNLRLSRRHLLQAGGAVVAAGALGRIPAALPAGAAPALRLVNPRSLTPFVDALPIPPTLMASTLHNGDLYAKAGEWRFHSQLGMSRTWGYTNVDGGAVGYLGPTIVAPRGEGLSFTAHNAIDGGHLLGVDTTLHGAQASDRTDPRIAIHLHGGYVAPESDGGPGDTFTPGADWRFTYPNDQGASTLWYHDHAVGITRLNAYAGLAGLYVITDGEAAGKLPTGAHDIPLALQDKSFSGQVGTRRPNPLHYPDPWAAEFFGTTPVVNGKVWPAVTVDRGFYRFRLLNGSSARFYHLRMSNPRRVPMWVVATDSGLLNAPVPVSSVIVSPGERVEIVLDLQNAPGSVTLDDVALPLDVVSPSPGPFGPMVQLNVTRRTGWTGFNPATPLRSDAYSATALAAAAVTSRRRLSLVEHVDPATGVPIMSMLNNLHFDIDDGLWEQPSADSVEVWEIFNLTADTHPIHLHLVHFLLLERQAFDVAGFLAANPMPMMGHGLDLDDADAFLLPTTRGPRAFETGWKDTVQAHPGEVTRIVVPFSGGVDPMVPFGREERFTGDYVWHCHILDHEDHEMMLSYRVTQ
jgi:spore coat protein A, manganese oxidase